MKILEDIGALTHKKIGCHLYVSVESICRAFNIVMVLAAFILGHGVPVLVSNFAAKHVRVSLFELVCSLPVSLTSGCRTVANGSVTVIRGFVETMCSQIYWQMHMRLCLGFQKDLWM